MSRVITFSRTYPSYHPKAGQPTYFVEKIYKSILKPIDHVPITGIENSLSLFALADALPKHHTIRAGHRWKIGDWFSPRVWSGIPYRSKQIQFASDIQVKKVWNFEVCRGKAICDDDIIFFLENYIPSTSLYNEIAQNDGLTLDDLYGWFNKPFRGQVICWNENINY
jgi:hypothetical protein